VIECMSVHYAEQITLEQLAAEAGISKYHFTRLFHQKLGKTPFRFLTEIRLAAARRMLVTTDLRAGEIALACGYSAASYFTIAFTARYGTPPLRFRSIHDA
jgi:AraC family transcriptional regulator